MKKKKVIVWCLSAVLICCLGFWGIKAAGNTNGQMVPEPWDIITFGSYEQDNNLSNGSEPIKWIVLSVEGDEALLLSKRCLDCMPYNEDETAVTWENCSLRKWLNTEFYNKAFSDSEKNKIAETLSINTDSDWGRDGGNSTLDKVFLLSLEEATESGYGFSGSAYRTDTSRRAPASAYAKAQGVWYGSDRGYFDEEDEDADEYGGIDSSYWWLRSVGETATQAVSVNDYGDIDTDGELVTEKGNGVRPAIYIKLGNNVQSSDVIGDINEDGEISAKDVTQLRRYLAGGWDVKINTTEADLNEDNEVNAKDVTILRRYLAGGWGVVLPKKTSDSAENIAINKSNFPDKGFRNYVKNIFDSNDDGFLSEKEIENAKVIDVDDYDLSDLTGVKFLSSLEKLYCGNNNLKNLDLSNNTALKELYCSNNQLESLNVKNNTELKKLSCGYNKLKSLELQDNVELVELACYGNALTSLDVSNNIALKELYCEENRLTNLDVSENTALDSLICYTNQLTNLDVSNNTVIRNLNCCDNQLIYLDVSNNDALYAMNCSGNKLANLDISKNEALVYLYCEDNQLTSLDISNNYNLKTLTCENNQLTFINLTNKSRLLKENGVSCDEGVILQCNVNKIELSDIALKDSTLEYVNNEFESDFDLQWNVNENGDPVLYFKKVNGDGYLEMDGEISVGSAIEIQKVSYYDEKERVIKKIDNGRICEYEYDENDRVIRELYDNLTYEYTYFSNGNCKTYSEENLDFYGGFRKIYKEYDVEGNLITAYGSSSLSELGEYRTEYDDNGKIIRTVDDNYSWTNTIIIHDFDENGNVIRRTTKENEEETGNEIVTIREVTYDDQGRVITGFELLDDYLFGHKWFYVEYTYDSKGRIIHKLYSMSDMLNSKFTRDYKYEYDELDRVISEDIYNHDYDTGDYYKKEYIYIGDTDVVKEEIYTKRVYNWPYGNYYSLVNKTEYSDEIVVRKTVTHIDDDGNDLGYLYVEEYNDGIISKSSERENLDGETYIEIYDAEGNPVKGIESGSPSIRYDADGRLIKNTRYSISYYDEGDIPFVEIVDNAQDSSRKYSFNREKGLFEQYYSRTDIEIEKEIIIDNEWNTIITHDRQIDDDGFSVEYWYDKDKRVLKSKDKQWSGKTYEALYEYFKNESEIDCRKVLTQYSDGSTEYCLQQYGYMDWDTDGSGYWAYERNVFAADGSYIKMLYEYDDRGVADDPYLNIKIDKDGNRFIYVDWDDEYVPIDSRIVII